MAKGTHHKTAYPTYWRQLKTVIGRDLMVTINSVTDSKGQQREFILRTQNSGRLIEKAANGAMTIRLDKRDTWPSGGILIKVRGSRIEGPVTVEYSWRTGKDAQQSVQINPGMHQDQLYTADGFVG